MNCLDTYKENSITTQNRGKLIVLLYDGAIKFLKIAIQELEKGDMIAKGRYINKASAIISELDVVLDMDAGGEIAENLHQLYRFMLRHLNQANMKKDPQRLNEVIDLLETLNKSWKAIC